MKHSELLKLLHDNKELIERAYRQDSIDNPPQELIDATLLIKISESYKLNKNYLNFVDSVLQRVDYSIIFGDYEKEYKELVKHKKRYEERGDEYYKSAILKIIDDLYFKFYNRDREIQILLLRLENDISLDMDILLENASDILEKIDELIDANEKIGVLFRQNLRGIHPKIDNYLQSISVPILHFIQNIDTYIQEINQFISQTKRRRFLNKQIIELSNKILDEDVGELDEFLELNARKLYFTVERSQKTKIHSLANDNDIVKMKKDLKEIFSNIEVGRPLKINTIKKQIQEKLKIVNLEKIMKDLSKETREDIFLFIKLHSELARFEQVALVDESFKVFLQIVRDERVVFSHEFNEFGIKVAKWQ